MAVVNNCLQNYLSKSSFPHHSLRTLSKIIDCFLHYESSFERCSKNSSLGPFMLNNFDYDVYEDDKILKFIKILLSEDRLYPVNDTKTLVKDCLHVTGHNECNEERVIEVMKFLRNVRKLCNETENCYIRYFDEKPCECYEYEVSGDCSCNG